MEGVYKDETTNEWFFPKNKFILSETDEKGIITYANAVFCAVAGYTQKELIGQPHNIVRHPDMPRAAFADLWDKAPRLGFWSGYVKNLCKDGGYYWVYAMVLRRIDPNTGRVSFLSVREVPSRDQIAKFSKLYAEMRAAE